MAVLGFIIVVILLMAVLFYNAFQKKYNVGRYVILERVVSASSGGDWLNIAGIEVTDILGFPLNLVGAESGSKLSEDMYQPSNLIDGNDDTFAHTGDGSSENNFSNVWFKVDLGSDQEIGEVIIKNRKDCCQPRIAGTRIRVVNNKGNDVYTSNAITDEKANDMIIKFMLPMSNSGEERSKMPL